MTYARNAALALLVTTASLVPLSQANAWCRWHCGPGAIIALPFVAAGAVVAGAAAVATAPFAAVAAATTPAPYYAPPPGYYGPPPGYYPPGYGAPGYYGATPGYSYGAPPPPADH